LDKFSNDEVEKQQLKSYGVFKLPASNATGRHWDNITVKRRFQEKEKTCRI